MLWCIYDRRGRDGCLQHLSGNINLQKEKCGLWSPPKIPIKSITIVCSPKSKWGGNCSQYEINGGTYFQRNTSGLYEKIKDLIEPTDKVESVFIEENNKILALGCFDGNAYIYRKMGSLYSINQTISFGFKIYHVELITVNGKWDCNFSRLWFTIGFNYIKKNIFFCCFHNSMFSDCAGLILIIKVKFRVKVKFNFLMEDVGSFNLIKVNCRWLVREWSKDFSIVTSDLDTPLKLACKDFIHISTHVFMYYNITIIGKYNFFKFLWTLISINLWYLLMDENYLFIEGKS